MSSIVKKILIDYEEYNRLLLIQKRYNELLKNKDMTGSGHDNDSLSKIAEENEVAASISTPVPKLIAGITDPPNEQELNRPWFYLGPPKENVRE